MNVRIVNIKKGDLLHSQRYGEEHAVFTILMKDNKYKVTISDFVHATTYAAANNLTGGPSLFNNHSSGGPVSLNYENEDIKSQTKDISKKEWVEIRQEGVNKMYKVLAEMASYVGHKDDMSF